MGDNSNQNKKSNQNADAFDDEDDFFCGGRKNEDEYAVKKKGKAKGGDDPLAFLHRA